MRIPEYDGLSFGINNPLEAAAVLVRDKEKFISLLFEQEEGIVNVLEQQGGHLLVWLRSWTTIL